MYDLHKMSYFIRLCHRSRVFNRFFSTEKHTSVLKRALRSAPRLTGTRIQGLIVSESTEVDYVVFFPFLSKDGCSHNDIIVKFQITKIERE